MSTTWKMESVGRREPTLARPTPGDSFLPCCSFAGSIEGYVFTTRESGTGYYKVVSPHQQPSGTPISLANTIPPPSIHRWSFSVNPSQRRTGARHALLPDGRRRRQGRRGRFGARSQHVWNAPAHADLTDGDWRAEGIWAVDTSSTNVWTSASTVVLLALRLMSSCCKKLVYTKRTRLLELATAPTHLGGTPPLLLRSELLPIPPALDALCAFGKALA